MGKLAQKFTLWGRALFSPEECLRDRYAAFKALLAADEQSLLLVADLEEIFAGARQVDPARTLWLCTQLSEAVGEVVARLQAMHPGPYSGLTPALERIRAGLDRQFPPCPGPAPSPSPPAPAPFLITLAQAQGRPELAGGKAANLALAGKAGLATPPGLVVTTRAFQHFLATGNLLPRLNRLLRQIDLARPERIGPLCAGMRALVLGAAMPPDLAQALREAAANPVLGGGLLAVRSSAVAEDGEFSFAGQYASELNVPPDDIVDAYRRVVAAKYRPRAVTYRVRRGLADECAPMAVLLLPMIDAAAAGVLHTSETQPGKDAQVQGQHAVVYALPGLADELVSGRAEPLVLRLPRQIPARVLSATGGAEAGFRPPLLTNPPLHTDPSLQTDPPLLTKQLLSDLVLAGLVLESVFGKPQEVEWALDRQGSLFILQSRGLSAPPQTQRAAEVIRPDSQILAEGLNAVAPGVGCGPVFHLSALADLPRVPAGCVLAVEALTPALARCVDKISAVVARAGSRASHFASVAREAGLPVLSGLEEPLARLPAGVLVTVDADTCRVLAGCADSHQLAPTQRRDAERQRLRERFSGLARHTCHLGLTDPEAPEFSPEGCASLHDVVRYCHEMAVAEMAGLASAPGGTAPAGPRLGKAKRLRAELPLSLYLLDLGGGLAPQAQAMAEVTEEDFASAPLLALWQGMAHSGEPWPDVGFACDWLEFDRISAGIFRKDSRLLASLALLSADYLHLLVRFGYHFAVLDCLCGPRAEANYACLRFKGGGGLPEQRRLRIVFLSQVLAASGFTVRVRGDMLDARLSRVEQQDLRRALVLLGRLLVRTQRMDLGLVDEAQAEELAEAFLSTGETTR